METKKPKIDDAILHSLKQTVEDLKNFHYAHKEIDITTIFNQLYDDFNKKLIYHIPQDISNSTLYNIIFNFNNMGEIKEKDKIFLEKYKFYQFKREIYSCQHNVFAESQYQQLDLANSLQFFVECLTNEEVTIPQELKDQLNAYQIKEKLIKQNNG